MCKKVNYYKLLLRFFGMYAPFESLRIAMYRKAGIRIGKVRYFGGNIFLDIVDDGSITIGDDVLLAGFDHILSHSFVLYGLKETEGYSPVVIKKGARISFDVTILRGVTIGENAVIGAGAVVTGDIPPNCLAVGIPAKPIHFYKSSK
jgi:acetyltransferase-like isoleucine patch superfamily enzyme